MVGTSSSSSTVSHRQQQQSCPLSSTYIILITDSSSSSMASCGDLEHLNNIVEKWNILAPTEEVATEGRRSGILPDSAWGEWLWGSDPAEPISADALLNRCHLLGLLWCRYRAVSQQLPPAQPPLNKRDDSLLLVITNTPIARTSLRELRDSITNLVLLWTKMRNSHLMVIKVPHAHLFSPLSSMS